MAHTPQNSWPKSTLILLGLLAVSLYMLQYWTLPKYAALPQNIISLKVFWSAVSYRVKPGWQDAIFFLLPALLFVGIIALEARRREFSNLLIRCCTSDRATCYLLAASAIVITR